MTFLLPNQLKMSKTILVVDDCKNIREIVTFTLENKGYNILTASDGEEALKHINTTHLDLVITDVNMPNKNGIELITDIRSLERYRFLPILLLTTEEHTGIKQQAKEAGATGWLEKPFVVETFVSTVKKVLT